MNLQRFARNDKEKKIDLEKETSTPLFPSFFYALFRCIIIIIVIAEFGDSWRKDFCKRDLDLYGNQKIQITTHWNFFIKFLSKNIV